MRTHFVSVQQWKFRLQVDDKFIDVRAPNTFCLHEADVMHLRRRKMLLFAHPDKVGTSHRDLFDFIAALHG